MDVPGASAAETALACVIYVAEQEEETWSIGCNFSAELDEASLVQYGHTPLGLGACTVYKGKGCATCHGTGMKGRVALYEVLPITPEIRGLILNSTFASEIQDVASKQGMKTLREAGLLKVLQGVTTVEEILRVTSE